MATLFISYARDDATLVRPLAAALERDGHSVWWDRHISGGQEFAPAIEEALDSADIVIVCWSANAVQSAWVRDEAAAGRDSGRLVPLTLDGSKPPLGFRQYQTIDLSRWNKRPQSHDLDAVKAAVARKLSGGSVPSAPSPTRNARDPRRWAPAAAAALALLAGGALVYSRVGSNAGNIEPKVAIGEFTLASAELPHELPAQLGQEIVAAFGAENAVTVVAPGDSANSARAPFVIEGSVSRLGPNLRTTINLRNGRSGVSLWSGAYEHEASDPTAARQAGVAASQVVRCGLWGAASYPRQMSDQALSLYLSWCNEHWSGSASPTAELDAARRVTVTVPDFSFGWSALALATVPLAAARTAEARTLRGEGLAAARQSMQLDGDNPEGYMAIAGLLPLGRYAEREELLKKALDVRPTECGCERQAYGDFLASVGRVEEAAVQYERARAMRPLAPFSNLRFAQALYIVGRNAEADRILTDTLKLWPDATSLRLLKMKSALWTGRYDEAIALSAAPDLPLTSTQRRTLAAAFQALKSRDPRLGSRSAAELERLASDPRYNDRLVVGTLAALGAREAAIRAAAALMRTRGLFDAEVLFEPNLARARADPLYAGLVKTLGLIDYWRSARVAPDICRDDAKPAYCSSA